MLLGCCRGAFAAGDVVGLPLPGRSTLLLPCGHPGECLGSACGSLPGGRGPLERLVEVVQRPPPKLEQADTRDATASAAPDPGQPRPPEQSEERGEGDRDGDSSLFRWLMTPEGIRGQTRESNNSRWRNRALLPVLPTPSNLKDIQDQAYDLQRRVREMDYAETAATGRIRNSKAMLIMGDNLQPPPSPDNSESPSLSPRFIPGPPQLGEP